MNTVYEKLMNCLDAIQKKVTFKPEVALILGSGLGDYANEMEIVDYSGVRTAHDIRYIICGRSDSIPCPSCQQHLSGRTRIHSSSGRKQKELRRSEAPQLHHCIGCRICCHAFLLVYQFHCIDPEF